MIYLEIHTFITKIAMPIALVIVLSAGITLMMDQKACLNDLREANPNWTIHSESELLIENDDVFYYVVKKDGVCVIGGIAKWK